MFEIQCNTAPNKTDATPIKYSPAKIHQHHNTNQRK